MNLLVVMDPLDEADPSGDTSLAVMSAAIEQGQRVWWCRAGDLWLSDGQVQARAQVVRRQPGGGLVGSDRTGLPLAHFEVVLVRVDPPVDAEYLAMTYLLEMAREDTVIVNDPRGLREANEKLWATQFPQLMPAFLVTSLDADILAFAVRHGGAVVKPLDGHGGRGVRHVDPGRSDAMAVITSATEGGRRLVMVQEFLPRVSEGDKRILLLDGSPLGVLVRRPALGEFRANLALGASAEIGVMEEGDRRIVEEIAPALRAQGLRLVGLDVIDGRLSEVNVTSPTGLVQIAELSGTRPDLVVAAWLEELAHR